jgi:hypothetical protein
MYSTHQNIASDITRMFRDYFYGAHVDTTPPRTQACEADDDFRHILECAAKDMRSEIDDVGEDTIGELDKMEAEYVRVCLPRMRIGYRKAKRRFEHHGRWFANSLFWAIAEAVDAITREVEYEGQEFELTFGRDRDGDIFARCEQIFEEEY